MRKRILQRVMLMAVSFLLMGCTAKAPNPANSSNPTKTSTQIETTQAQTPETTQSKESQKMNDKISKTVELLSTVEWIGKTKEELDLDPDSSETMYDFSTTIGGFKGSGTVFFDRKSKTVKNIIATINKSSVNDFYDELADLYGGPLSEIMIPYAQSNGGARRGFTFDAGKAVLSLSEGSITDYVSFDIKINTNPDDTGELVLRLQEEQDYSKRQSVLMKVIGYSNGVVTAKVWNQSGTTASFIEDAKLCRETDDRSGYYYMTEMSAGAFVEQEQTEHTLVDKESLEITLDMRRYGKVKPGKYKLISDDVRAEFELIPKKDDTGEIASAPWFCPECGQKNNDKFCTNCGKKKP